MTRMVVSLVPRMSFAVTAEAYDRFMGRYSIRLSPLLADFADVRAGQTALDVGCGPGALTGELVKRLGAESVWAVDPTAAFVSAIEDRYPGVDARIASAETLPFNDQTFDRSIAQLVVHFMADPIAGLTEMKRVTKPGGVVAACVWDYGGGRGAVSPFWDAARQLDPDVDDESDLPGARHGHLVELFAAASLDAIEQTALNVRVEHQPFADWWEPFTLGVGPAGSYYKALNPDDQAKLRRVAETQIGQIPFTVDAYAWGARGTVPNG